MKNYWVNQWKKQWNDIFPHTSVAIGSLQMFPNDTTMPRILQVANIESFCEILKWWKNLQKKKKKLNIESICIEKGVWPFKKNIWRVTLVHLSIKNHFMAIWGKKFLKEFLQLTFSTQQDWHFHIEIEVMINSSVSGTEPQKC